MLLWLAEVLSKDVRAFNVFGYLTLRAVLACMTALVISFVVGPRMIAWLTRMKIGQAVRDDGPRSHLSKAGTPTMGGALIIVSIAITTLLWGDLENRFVWVVLLVMLGYGAIGWIDDYRKVVYRNPKGLSARAKLAAQAVIGLVAAVYLAFAVSAPDAAQAWRLLAGWVQSGFAGELTPKADLIVPFFKTITYPLGVWGFIVLSWFVIVGTSNAVNLTDGLDGLAIMPTVMVGAGARRLRVRHRQRDLRALPAVPVHRGRGRARGHLRRDRRRGPGLPVVQRLPGRGVHGRRRRAVARRGPRRDRRDRAPGDRASDHGRRVRRRDAVGDRAGRVVQADRQARVPHGADPPPLRAQGLEGEPGRRPVLDHHDAARAVRALHAEAAMSASYQGRRAVVLGLGLTGYTLARWLAKHGATVSVADTRPHPPNAERLARENPGIPLETGPFTASTFAGADVIAISPGVAKDQPAIADAVAAGADLVGDVELFARELPPAQKLLAITGTNGKTTTTALAGELARAAGLAATVAGNIGDAVLDALEPIEAGAPWPDVFVLELSSYQLETTSSLRPTAATVLNVTANHMDRYAGIADYAAAKARIFNGATVQVLNRDDPIVRLMRRKGETLQTFGASVPISEEEWGPGDAARRRMARARRRAARARRVARAGRGVTTRSTRSPALALVSSGRAHPPAGARGAARVPRPAAPDGARRRGERRAVRQRFQGDDGRGDVGRAGRDGAARGPDRRRRRQGPELRPAARRRRPYLPRRAS
jgi:hypothetical protein